MRCHGHCGFSSPRFVYLSPPIVQVSNIPTNSTASSRRRRAPSQRPHKNVHLSDVYRGVKQVRFLCSRPAQKFLEDVVELTNASLVSKMNPLLVPCHNKEAASLSAHPQDMTPLAVTLAITIWWNLSPVSPFNSPISGLATCGYLGSFAAMLVYFQKPEMSSLTISSPCSPQRKPEFNR
jgi:hypothetical protein